MALARAWSVALVGVEGRLVEVEADVGGGLPGLHLVGLPDAALTESKDRVRALDNTLVHRWYEGGWSGWEPLGGPAIASGPAAASWSPGHLDVFARSVDNTLIHRGYPSTRIRSRGANPRRLASRMASAGPPLASCLYTLRIRAWPAPDDNHRDAAAN